MASRSRQARRWRSLSEAAARSRRSAAMRTLLRWSVAITVLIAAGPAHAVTVGIGDQYTGTWSDPRFAALGVQEVRLIVPWDAVDKDPWTAAACLDAGHDRNLHPLVAFEHSHVDDCPNSPCTLPPLDAYKAAVTRFHELW